ncbi:aspartate/glutamate racemase family protein, partial [Pseudomonas syringae pv. tagetis]
PSLSSPRFRGVTPPRLTRIIADHVQQLYGLRELCPSVLGIDLPLLALEESAPQQNESIPEQACRAPHDQRAGANEQASAGNAEQARQQ